MVGQLVHSSPYNHSLCLQYSVSPYLCTFESVFFCCLKTRGGGGVQVIRWWVVILMWWWRGDEGLCRRGSFKVVRLWVACHIASRWSIGGGVVVVTWFCSGEVGLTCWDGCDVMLVRWVGLRWFWGDCEVVLRWWVAVKWFWDVGKVVLWRR
jgi:hypothetical protein